ncbi:MAG: hypothetical protein NTZ13_02170 [Candidatus Parcubacteria bacterium]|nr:hypothetical protein [Candidatus Parcubacteria bacterium]
MNKKQTTILETFKTNVDIDTLRCDADKIVISHDTSYFISYPEFIKYFSDIKQISKHNVIIGINFTYGWMPTIFNFRSKDFDNVVLILNNAKKGIVPQVHELETLKKCFNNSLVGTSKLLHFINPEIFAIWDSRVYRYLTNHRAYNYHLNNYESYLAYLEFCKYITNQPGFDYIHNSIIKKMGNEITKYRTAELVMFLSVQ